MGVGRIETPGFCSDINLSSKYNILNPYHIALNVVAKEKRCCSVLSSEQIAVSFLGFSIYKFDFSSNNLQFQVGKIFTFASSF